MVLKFSHFPSTFCIVIIIQYLVYNWTVTISTDELPKKAEYKYVLMENEKVIKWSDGCNKSYCMDSLCQMIQNSKNSLSHDTTEIIEIVLGGSRKLNYDPVTKELILFEEFDSS